MSKTSVQAVDQPRQSLWDGLLNGTYKITRSTEAKDKPIAWLALSNINHFLIPLDSTSNKQQVFRVKADLAKPDTIHPHQIRGNTGFYEYSNPALWLGI